MLKKKNKDEQKYVAEEAEVQRSKFVPQFLREFIPQITRTLALKFVRNVQGFKVPNHHENRYAEAIAAAHQGEINIDGTHHTIAWHFEQILLDEATKDIEYFINLELDIKKVHAVDRPRLKVKMMSQCIEAAKQGDKKPKSNLELAVAAFPLAIKELTKERVQAMGLVRIDQNRYVDSIVTAYEQEAVVGNDTRHPIAWHFAGALNLRELEEEVDQLVNDRTGEVIVLVGRKVLVVRIMEFFISRLRKTMALPPTLRQIAENVIDFHRGMTPEQVSEIIKNGTTDAELLIPKDPVALLDLRPLGAADKPVHADASRRNKIYTRGFIKEWFKYETIQERPAPVEPVVAPESRYFPCEEMTPDNEIRYQNAKGELDPNGYPVPTHHDRDGKAPHPISGEPLEYSETRFYNARHLLTMQMVAAAEAINQNAKKVAADPNYPPFTFREDEQAEIHGNIWYYLNGLNPDTGKFELGWLTQAELDAAIADLNKFIRSSHPEQWQGGAPIEVQKAAEYFRLLRIDRLTPINPEDFVMNATHDGITPWINENDQKEQADNKESVEAQDLAALHQPFPSEEIKREDESQKILLFSSPLSSSSSSASAAVSAKSDADLEISGSRQGLMLSRAAILVSSASNSSSLLPMSVSNSNSSNLNLLGGLH